MTRSRSVHYWRAGLAALLVLLVAAVLRSEGPLTVGGPTDVPGLPFIWTINPLTYWTDQGTLGSLSNTQADTFVQQSFQVWQDVPTANITFSRAGKLPADVNGGNILQVLNSMLACSTPLNPTSTTVIARDRTIVYDTDGSAIQAMNGDPSTILGEASPICYTSDGTTNYYTRGFAILNGRFATTSAQSELQSTMVHEFGHLIGLDHSQINLDCLTNPMNCPTGSPEALGLPIMFPIAILNVNIDQTFLATDDEAGLSVLYPETGDNGTTQIPFSSLGRIQGQVYFSDGVTPAQGFNVIARNVANPEEVAVSNVSGYRFTGCVGVPASVIPPPNNLCDPTTGEIFGSTDDQTLIGFYDIPGLPPGTYTVEVEAINNSGRNPFVGGSGLNPIGPLGFEFPLIAPCTPLYLMSGQPAACSNGSQLTVAAGTTLTTGTDVILSGTTGDLPRYDAWEDGP